MNNIIQDRYHKKYSYPVEHFLHQSVKVLTQISGLRNGFEIFVVFSTIRLRSKVYFFIREFLEVFYFPSNFIVVAENF